jgi:hypothetical protein
MDLLHVHNLMYRCYMSYIGASTRGPQYTCISNIDNTSHEEETKQYQA